MTNGTLTLQADEWFALMRGFAWRVRVAEHAGCAVKNTNELLDLYPAKREDATDDTYWLANLIESTK
jgi:hypothetical protein